MAKQRIFAVRCAPICLSPHCLAVRIWRKYLQTALYIVAAVVCHAPSKCGRIRVRAISKLAGRAPFEERYPFGCADPAVHRGFCRLRKNVAVQGIFKEKTEKVLRNLKVDFIWFGYMGVNDANGHLMVNKTYLSTGRKIDIYLDVVHELCHVKQHLDGRELFDPQYDYVDRPTEIEAYRYAVLEAKRLGLRNAEIRLYLKTEMMSPNALERLIENMGVPLDAPDGG
jgi:hypothetical protein